MGNNRNPRAWKSTQFHHKEAIFYYNEQKGGWFTAIYLFGGTAILVILGIAVLFVLQ